MMGKTSGDSSRRVSRIIFSAIQDSFTTQGLRRSRVFRGGLDRKTGGRRCVFAITIRVMSPTPAATQSRLAR
jgi:hypothetical protein